MFTNRNAQPFPLPVVVVFLVDPNEKTLADPNVKGLNFTMPSALAPRTAR